MTITCFTPQGVALQEVVVAVLESLHIFADAQTRRLYPAAGASGEEIPLEVVCKAKERCRNLYHAIYVC
jgi:hypothetical protein